MLRRGYIINKISGLDCLIILLLMISMVCVIIMLFLRPIMRDLAVNYVEFAVSRAVNESINTELGNGNYNDLVVVDKDKDNKVSALHTNMVKINSIKTNVVNSIYDCINALEKQDLEIPIGNLIPGYWFVGDGLKVNIGIMSLGYVEAKFVSSFTDAGINQTRHNIVMEIYADVKVFFPGGGSVRKIRSDFNITDTILIGDVPDSYTYIEDSNSSNLDKFKSYSFDRK